jgi:hypothetical protein
MCNMFPVAKSATLAECVLNGVRLHQYKSALPTQDMEPTAKKYRRGLLFWSYLLPVLAGAWRSLTNVLHGFLQSLKASSRTIAQ